MNVRLYLWSALGITVAGLASIMGGVVLARTGTDSAVVIAVVVAIGGLLAPVIALLLQIVKYNEERIVAAREVHAVAQTTSDKVDRLSQDVNGRLEQLIEAARSEGRRQGRDEEAARMGDSPPRSVEVKLGEPVKIEVVPPAETP